MLYVSPSLDRNFRIGMKWVLVCYSPVATSATSIYSAYVAPSVSARSALKSPSTRSSAPEGRLLMSEMTSSMVESFSGAM